MLFNDKTILKRLSLIHIIFILLLIGCLMISFYMMIITLFTYDNIHNRYFTAWQFPMLLAILLDTIYHNGRFKKYIF